MQPLHWFPFLALALTLAGLWAAWRAGKVDPMAQALWLAALIFGAVAVWLRL